ncbi:MAG: tyrosine-type recombinase/integrase, partial [Candidatus Zixiibacteriota bacterium]
MASIHFKKRKDGGKTYYVVVCMPGSHKWIKGGSLKDAKILKKEIESLEKSKRIEKLGLVNEKKRIDAFFQEYADHVRLRTAPSTLKRYLTVLNTVIIFLKMFHPKIKFLVQITPEIIESYQVQRLKSIELKSSADGDKSGVHRKKRLPLPQTVNTEVIVLGSAFIWAYSRELIPSVPTKKVKPLRAKLKRKVRLLDQRECKHFLKTARQMARDNKRLKVFYLIFKFLLNTGLRSGELCNLTWDDVNLETGLIKIQPKEGWTPKTYSREFFLNEHSIKILKRIGQSEGLIFRTNTGKQLDTDDIRRALIKIAKEAGLNDLTKVHDLRHTFNSLMQMNGVDPATM